MPYDNPLISEVNFIYLKYQNMFLTFQDIHFLFLVSLHVQFHAISLLTV